MTRRTSPLCLLLFFFFFSLSVNEWKLVEVLSELRCFRVGSSDAVPRCSLRLSSGHVALNQHSQQSLVSSCQPTPTSQLHLRPTTSLQQQQLGGRIAVSCKYICAGLFSNAARLQLLHADGPLPRSNVPSGCRGRQNAGQAVHCWSGLVHAPAPTTSSSGGPNRPSTAENHPQDHPPPGRLLCHCDGPDLVHYAGLRHRFLARPGFQLECVERGHNARVDARACVDVE